MKFNNPNSIIKFDHNNIIHLNNQNPNIYQNINYHLMNKKYKHLIQISLLENNCYQKREYLNELNSTLSITSDKFDVNRIEYHQRNSEPNSLKGTFDERDYKSIFKGIRKSINKIRIKIAKHFYLRKEKFNINSNVLLNKDIKKKQFRDKKHFNNNKRQFIDIEDNFKNKKLLMIKGKEMFWEFEKHYTIFRVQYQKYKLFNIKKLFQKYCIHPKIHKNIHYLPFNEYFNRGIHSI